MTHIQETDFSRSRRRTTARRGFSAVEIIAVATIMAILALILIPIIGNRVEHAKIVAATEDLASLGKAVTLAYADTDHYFRLQDYDNSTAYTTNPALDPDFNPGDEVPVAYWDTMQYISAAERLALKSKWQGRYIPFKRTVTLYDIYSSPGFVYAVTVLQPDTGAPISPATQRGPILIFDTGDPRDELIGGTDDPNTYPVDPWGAPYFFFAPGYLSNTETGVVVYESDFKGPLLVSLGPDSRPGNTEPSASWHFIRGWDATSTNKSPLGTEDDIVHEF
ncbi:prepilin-type N-terminal cleavage/methylation domain-containing protein [Candidatus Sumerlaeota bacterium]|nr:prepilin-type N-terminal cleavage/methylation domain-containing protein [Candidatus Sumerlaeota bacterium]